MCSLAFLQLRGFVHSEGLGGPEDAPGRSDELRQAGDGLHASTAGRLDQKEAARGPALDPRNRESLPGGGPRRRDLRLWAASRVLRTFRRSLLPPGDPEKVLRIGRSRLVLRGDEGHGELILIVDERDLIRCGGLGGRNRDGFDGCLRERFLRLL